MSVLKQLGEGQPIGLPSIVEFSQFLIILQCGGDFKGNSFVCFRFLNNKKFLSILNTISLGKRSALLKAVIFSGLCKNIFVTWSVDRVEGAKNALTRDMKRPFMSTVFQLKG